MNRTMTVVNGSTFSLFYSDHIQNNSDYETPVVVGQNYQDQNPPIAVHRNLDDFVDRWKAKKSEGTVDHHRHLEQVRQTRERIMENVRAYTISASSDNSQPNFIIEKNRDCDYPSLEESLWAEVNHRRRQSGKGQLREKPSRYSQESNLYDPVELEIMEIEAITPHETENVLQQLIDDSVRNLAWATKTLYKYRSLQQSQQELKQLKRKRIDDSPVSFENQRKTTTGDTTDKIFLPHNCHRQWELGRLRLTGVISSR